MHQLFYGKVLFIQFDQLLLICSVDMAVIHSKLAKSSQHNGSPGGVSEFPVPPIPLPGQARGDEIDPISKLLEKAGRVAQEQAVAATRTSQLQTQSQPLPPRQPRGNRPKRTQRSQIPNKAVEMPGSMADSLDVQFGNLEFGGDSVASPKKKQVLHNITVCLHLSTLHPWMMTVQLIEFSTKNKIITLGQIK